MGVRGSKKGGRSNNVRHAFCYEAPDLLRGGLRWSLPLASQWASDAPDLLRVPHAGLAAPESVKHPGASPGHRARKAVAWVETTVKHPGASPGHRSNPRAEQYCA